MRRKDKSKIVAFILGIILMGVGYAYLTANLKITGTAKISNSKWDVHFENAVLVDASETTTFQSNSNSNIGTPIIKGEDRQELEYEVTFNQPGDYYEFNVDVVNAGDIDAMLDVDNSTYKISIDNGQEIEINSEESYNTYWPKELIYFYRFDENFMYLHSGENTTMTIRLSLDTDITNEEWENLKGKKIKIITNIPYIQGTGSSSNVNSNINSNNNEPVHVRFTNPTYVGSSSTTVLSNGNVPSLNNVSTGSTKTEHNINYSVLFNNPGDYYEFNLTLINDGDYVAKVYREYAEIKIDNGETNSFGSFDGAIGNYSDMFEIEIIEDNANGTYHSISENSTKTFTIKLKVKDNISEENLNMIKNKTLYISHFLDYRAEIDTPH